MSVVLYHGGCCDGWGAAWVASKFLQDPTLIPVSYGKPAPLDECVDDIVYVVDFSYPREELIELAGVAYRVIVLDHHRSAEKELADLAVPNLFIEFDMERSGCMITWDYFADRCPTNPVANRMKKIADYVQDRDLWTWALPNSRAVSAYIAAVPKTVEHWDALLLIADWADIIRGGLAIRMKIESDVATMTRESKWALTSFRAIDDIAIINICIAAPGSEIIGTLAEGRPLAVGWAQGGDGSFYYSLRSDVDGVDVGALAASLKADGTAFAGGGHARAAGFSSWSRPNELFTRNPS